MKVFFSTLLLLAVIVVKADSPLDSLVNRKWYKPDFIPVQFAGDIGLISTGIGYSSPHSSYQMGLHYGYVPFSVANTEIHTLAIRNTFNINRWRIPVSPVLIPYGGLMLSLEVSDNAFLFLPDHYRKGYYFQKAAHIHGYVGLRTRFDLKEDFFIKGIEGYVEGGSMDAYIWYKLRSSELSLRQIMNIAIGINILLH
jgi:hypothetical protein